mmetsp:Transcript_31935/g.95626  ORF Transcript_31935/g.95626 Transcript_31935/m.95626 type:complete len:216 (-) Transcript_31935:340-987(-)|eukprot:CAMPEP_0113550736 /NCGR_PEP_ID=MMETSP0015_2-20120614/14143_1 /TAXON_ID=2838 /ORGANISM="Odontella" /LENGTH=215 /DNA_ID=CAMNT_0000451567 /DNA_START=264 /DNA_END=911 /DNA_ORIENTATION=+ /assembly_acc=CAM_ASM_000160
MKTSETGVATVATLLLVLALDSAEAHASPSACNSGAKSAFIGRRIVDPCRQSEMLALSVRGGARRVYDDEDEYDSDVDEYDSESEEEEERVAMLSKSTRKAAVKVKSKKAAVMKKAVSASLSQTKPKKQKSLLAILHVPYIMRACLNPFTFLAMTKAYFASLFNIDYLAEDSSQTLRSALEDKAKKAASTGGKKKKRQFKPGQAKTLSDLPQLSA